MYVLGRGRKTGSIAWDGNIEKWKNKWQTQAQEAEGEAETAMKRSETDNEKKRMNDNRKHDSN